jgi:acetyl coenzyme A synthetase (ADP forming)-like protein
LKRPASVPAGTEAGRFGDKMPRMTDQPIDHPLESLDPIFSPRNVAVIGASRNRSSLGFALLHNLVMSEFTGAIFPVNPKARVIHSLKAYPSVGDIPDPVDLAVVMVPQPAVQGVVEGCIDAGVKGLVVITAGFAETGEAGAAAERKLQETVRQAGVRMIGPNCMGVINTDPGVSLDATFSPTSAERGSIGFLSQSGALGVAILNAASDLGIGLTQFASMGNKADVSGNDLVEYWENDPSTRVICMYLESFGNPRHFTGIAKRVSRKKPILIVKSGRTEEGARAASSHTGAIAGADVPVSAFLEQCGVIRANTIDELFDIATALDRCPLPYDRRIAIVTNAGGPAIMATDACVDLGLEIAELSPATRQRLEAFLPPEASVNNPVDMIASATAEDYARALGIVQADDNVDMVMVINVTPLLTNPIDVLDQVAASIEIQEKPVVAVMMATEDFYDEVKVRPDLPPVYRFPESAARALAKLYRYSAWRRKPEEETAPTFEVDDTRVSEILDGAGDGYLPDDKAFEVLELYGIPVAPWRIAAGSEGVAPAAAEIGYPVVLKAMAPEVVHKSDVGAVKVDLRNEEELVGAVDEIRSSLAAAGHSSEQFLVQTMARGGHEVIFGISIDPRFGPLLMFGLGGRYVEVFRDVRFGVTPLTASEALEMIRGIRGFALLTGVRGEAPADLEVLQDVLLRLAQLAVRHPQIQELDINPFLAAAGRGESCALDARIRVGPSTLASPAES